MLSFDCTCALHMGNVARAPGAIPDVLVSMGLACSDQGPVRASNQATLQDRIGFVLSKKPGSTDLKSETSLVRLQSSYSLQKFLRKKTNLDDCKTAQPLMVNFNSTETNYSGKHFFLCLRVFFFFSLDLISPAVTGIWTEMVPLLPVFSTFIKLFGLIFFLPHSLRLEPN